MTKGLHDLPPVRSSVALVAAFAACSSAPIARPVVDLARFAALSAKDFPGAERVLSGLAPSDADPALLVGDAALYGVEFRRGARVERQLLLLEVVRLGSEVHQAAVKTSVNGGEAVSRSYPIRGVVVALCRYDQDGREVQQSEATLYEEPLQAGWWPRTEADATDRQLDLSFLLTMSLQGLANDDPTLKDLLFTVVDPPSVFSIATHLGVSVTMRWVNDGVRPCDLPDLPTAQPVRLAAMELLINGASSLWVEMLVTPPTGALIVGGGVIGAVARHPDDAERIAAMRLLATRRGERGVRADAGEGR